MSWAAWMMTRATAMVLVAGDNHIDSDFADRAAFSTAQHDP